MQKSTLFPIGCKALECATGKVGHYKCPVCLKEHSNSDGLTLEHAPQKSIGGKKIALTCASPCNRLTDSTVEKAVKVEQLHDDFRWRRMEKKKSARFETGPYNLNSTVLRNESGMRIEVSEKNDPIKLENARLRDFAAKGTR